MEIRHLQTFIAIVELGSFTKAADNLGYAQSTITAHIKILEDELKEKLFDRLGKKIVLTNVGKALVPYAKKILYLYGEIKNITSEASKVTGDLVIGAGESLCIYRLGSILKEYKKRFPKVNIILKSDTCCELRRKLHRGEFDIVFTIEPQVQDKELVIKNLKDERMIIIGGEGSNIEKDNIIFGEKGCSGRIVFEEYLKDKGIKVSNPLEFSSIETIKKCVINGLGVAFLPYYIVKNEVKEGLLQVTEVEDKYNESSTQLIYHKNKSISLAMHELIKLVLEYSLKWED